MSESTGNHTPARPVCQACGTWTCSACGWSRVGASRENPQDCGRCSSTDGTLTPTRHHAGRGYYEDHNPAAGPLCATFATTRFGYACGHRSCRVIAWNR